MWWDEIRELRFEVVGLSNRQIEEIARALADKGYLELREEPEDFFVRPTKKLVNFKGDLGTLARETGLPREHVATFLAGFVLAYLEEIGGN